MKTHVEIDQFIKKTLRFYYLQFWLNHCFSLTMLPLVVWSPGYCSTRAATVLPQLRHHSNGIFDPVCGILDLDVYQRGIKGAYWLKAAAVLKPQRRGDCGSGDGVWALRVSSRPRRWEDSGVRCG